MGIKKLNGHIFFKLAQLYVFVGAIAIFKTGKIHLNFKQQLSLTTFSKQIMCASNSTSGYLSYNYQLIIFVICTRFVGKKASKWMGTTL